MNTVDGNNRIHPTAIIDGDVELGTDNVIDAYCVLRGPIVIGDGNKIGPHAIIGTDPQDVTGTEPVDPRQLIRIGNRNTIREFTAVQKPCYRPETRLGDDVYLMQSVHIPHDAHLDNGVVVTPMVALAGITTVQQGTNLGMGSSVHQKTVIGAYSMVATGAPVVKNLRPFSLLIPGKPLGINRHAARRAGFEDLLDEIEAYVLHDERPTSDRLLVLVEKFEAASAAYSRPEYR